MTNVAVASHIAYHSLGTSAAENAIEDDLAAKFTQHIQQLDYPHPDFTNATAISNPATPNINTLVKRNAFGQTFLQGLGLSPNANGPTLTVQLPSGLQAPAYAVLQMLANGGATLWNLDQYGSMQMANALLIGNDTAAATNALAVRSSSSPTVDIAYVGDNGGTLANRYLRVMSNGQVVGRLGIYVGAAGAEVLALDSLGQIISRRSIREFGVTFSGVALTASAAAGRYVDSAGTAIDAGVTTVTATSHATNYVWWTWSKGIGGVDHFTANSAGGNTVAGSATKAAGFPLGDYPIGYIRVPPNVTTLAAAVFDDWRGANTGDGNVGASGTVVSGIVISAPGTSQATMQSQTGVGSAINILDFQASNVSQGAYNGAALGSFAYGGNIGMGALRSGQYDAGQNALLRGYVSPFLAYQPNVWLSVSGLVVTLNLATGLEITGRYFYNYGNATATATSAVGLKDIFADYAAASTAVQTIGVTNGGSGYTSGATAAITGGGGSGATASVQVTSGVVTGLTVTAPGTGYTTPPIVTISPVGAGSGAAAMATLNMFGLTIVNRSPIFGTTVSAAPNSTSRWIGTFLCDGSALRNSAVNGDLPDFSPFGTISATQIRPQISQDQLNGGAQTFSNAAATVLTTHPVILIAPTRTTTYLFEGTFCPLMASAVAGLQAAAQYCDSGADPGTSGYTPAPSNANLFGGAGGMTFPVAAQNYFIDVALPSFERIYTPGRYAVGLNCTVPSGTGTVTAFRASLKATPMQA